MRKIHASVAVLSLLSVVPVAAAQEAPVSAPPDGTRLIFGPTAQALPKGQVYFGVYEFLMPFVQVGVTDRFSLGGGTPLFFGVDESHRPFWITPKLQIVHHGGTDVAAGAIHVANLDGGDGGIGYVVMTHGGDAGSFTAGAGLAYTSDGGRAPVFMVGGERQMRPGLRFITENYVWENGQGLATGAVRFYGGRLSADVGLGVPIGLGEMFAFPVINFVYRF
jgi:hypothetical protein